MTSILTNVAAQVALQALTAASARTDSSAMRVATGLKVGSAIDDASSYSIAQGVRSTLKAWSAVEQGLMTGRPTIGVALTGATTISDLVNDLEGKLTAYHGMTDAASRAILADDVDAILNQIDHVANGSVFNGINLINSDQAGLIDTPPADEGIAFTVGSGGSNVHALSLTPGTIRVDFSAGGSGGGNIRLLYNGSIVDSNPLNPPNQSGTLTFAYPAAPTQSITIAVVGNPALTADYTFFLDEQAQASTVGGFRIIRNVDGDSIDVQFRSLLAADLGLRPPGLASIEGAIAQIASAKQEISLNLGYYGSKLREVDNAQRSASKLVDAMREGLGSIVDADLGRESVRLIADQTREQLNMQGLAIANSQPNVMLNLFKS